MKRFLAILLAVTLAACLYGCGGAENALSSVSAAQESEASSGQGSGTDAGTSVESGAGEQTAELSFGELTTEQELISYLSGDWSYIAPDIGMDALGLTISGDGTYSIKRETPDGSAKYSYSGKWTLTRLYAADNELPDLLSFGLDKTDDPDLQGATSVGDYTFYEAAVCDGKLYLSAEQANNGNSLFSYVFDDFYPTFSRATSRKTDETAKKDSVFYAKVWMTSNTDDGNGMYAWLMYLDHDENGLLSPDSDVCVPYVIADSSGLGEGPAAVDPFDGSTFEIETNADGTIIRADVIQESYSPTSQEESASTLLAEVPEVKELLDKGMIMLFDGSEDINGENCVVIALGTDSEEQFVREVYYAVSPGKSIYRLDPMTGNWVPVPAD